MKIKVDLKIFFIIICYILTNKIKTFSIIFFFTLLHELGHLFSGIILGLRLKKIECTMAGFSIEFEDKKINNYILKNKRRITKNIIVDAGGPIINVIFVLIGFGIKNTDIIYANLIIFLVNILPIIPLDGGRILKNFLLYKYTFKTVNNVIIEISKYNLIILTLIGSIVVIYLKNIMVSIFIIYLWCLYIKEKHTSNMIKNMYKIIGEELLFKNTRE